MSLIDTITSAIDPAPAELDERAHEQARKELMSLTARIDVTRRTIATLETMLHQSEDRLASLSARKIELLTELERRFHEDQAHAALDAILNDMEQLVEDVQRHPSADEQRHPDLDQYWNREDPPSPAEEWQTVREFGG